MPKCDTLKWSDKSGKRLWSRNDYSGTHCAPGSFNVHDDRDPAVTCRANIEEEIATSADEVAQNQDQLASTFVIVNRFSAVITVGIGHAPAFLPRVGVVLEPSPVFGGVVAPMVMAGFLPPTIVD